MALRPSDVERYAKYLVCAVNYTGDILFDLTPYIVVPSYNVQRKAEYYEWEDMRHNVHRKVKRATTSGSFELFIDDMDVMNEFINAFPPYMASVPLFVIPTDMIPYGSEALESYVMEAARGPFNDFAVSYTLVNDFPYYGRKKHNTINVTISNKVNQITDWMIAFTPTDYDDEEEEVPEVVEPKTQVEGLEELPAYDGGE